MSIKQFARDLVLAGELDPMYDFISRGRLLYGQEWAENYVLHFFMFYNAGAAARVASCPSGEFWHHALEDFAVIKRGTERRHFRGAMGLEALKTLRSKGTPGEILYKLSAPTYQTLVWRVEQYFRGCQIGPYFTWKIMDLLDRALDQRVELNQRDAVKYLPEQPVKAAKLFYPLVSVGFALDIVVSYIDDLLAPGYPSRLCGYPEAETVLCAMLGRYKGSYSFGDDLNRRHQELKDYPYLRSLLNPIKDWSRYEHTVDPKSVSA